MFVWENGLHYALFYILSSSNQTDRGADHPSPTWFIYSAIPLGYFRCVFPLFKWGQGASGELPHVDENTSKA